MARIGKNVIYAGLETLYYTGGYRLARSFLGGLGAILTLHRVRPPLDGEFQPNRSLEIEPQFLDEVLTRLADADFDFVTLDEACRRIASDADERRFVALTFDDGHHDFREHALPVLRRHDAPVMLYVPSSFAEGNGVLWWIELERAIAASDTVELEMDGEPRRFDTATDADKQVAFSAIYAWLRSLTDEDAMRRICRSLAVNAGVEVDGICRELCMGWDDVAAVAADPLVTIGAHTDNHMMLAKMSGEAARREMVDGARKIEQRLGIRPRHFAFPVGDPTSAGQRDFEIAAGAGFATAVTTRPGVLFPDHRDHLAALPRISLNGDFQRFRYLDVLLSGAPTALMNGFKRVNAA